MGTELFIARVYLLQNSLELCCKCWCSNTHSHSCQHTSIVAPKHSYIALSYNFLGCHNLASEGLLFQMQSIFPYQSNNFSALLQELRLNNSFSMENSYVPWHTRRKRTVQTHRILKDKDNYNFPAVHWYYMYSL